MNQSTNKSKLYKTLRIINSKAPNLIHKTIGSSAENITNRQKQAKILIHHYPSTSTLPKLKSNSRTIRHKHEFPWTTQLLILACKTHVILWFFNHLIFFWWDLRLFCLVTSLWMLCMSVFGMFVLCSFLMDEPIFYSTVLYIACFNLDIQY